MPSIWEHTHSEIKLGGGLSGRSLHLTLNRSRMEVIRGKLMMSPELDQWMRMLWEDGAAFQNHLCSAFVPLHGGKSKRRSSLFCQTVVFSYRLHVISLPSVYQQLGWNASDKWRQLHSVNNWDWNLSNCFVWLTKDVQLKLLKTCKYSVLRSWTFCF